MPVPASRPVLEASPAQVTAHIGRAQVNLFWKIAVDDVHCLNDVVLPYQCGHLQRVSDPYVCLLFFGGRD